MDDIMLDRARGCAVGAAVGDALGMPLEFKPARPLARLEREMIGYRLPAGTFTDDTEMALALAESLLAHRPLDPADLAARFLQWYCAGPEDVGGQVRRVLDHLVPGVTWMEASSAAQRIWPAAAGNGSIMRCWPVALVYYDDLERLVADSRLQSEVTHPHAECMSASAFLNAVVFELLHGAAPRQAVEAALRNVQMPAALCAAIEAAPGRSREDLPNTGWVRHTVTNAVWGLLTGASFEDALVRVINLGDDADTVGAVTGMLAGAAYGLNAIPAGWRSKLRGAWPINSATIWREPDFVRLADRLIWRYGS
jgi:ADP-ribosyl-[dinitrogen reductase] hydrolase